MHYGISVPIFDHYADARVLAGLARDAEEAGWDGFFIWDHMATPWPVKIADTWVALTAIALNTKRVRFGPMVTPLPRRRPWKVARETASLDQLSGGRLILGVGLGFWPQELEYLGEISDLKARAAMLDEGLDVLTGLWSGKPFSYNGEYYKIQEAQFLPTPVQSPRIPIWVAGTWPIKAPFRRAARWDGVQPIHQNHELEGRIPVDQEKEIIAFIQQHRKSDEPFDVVHGGGTSGKDRVRDAEIVAPYAAAGVTWWLEGIVPERWGDWGNWPLAEMHQRILDGPPRA
ncbi:MAG TPA: LLM class flavin-dependent oxidoreductase [Ktedonobacteraceae bacterium]